MYIKISFKMYLKQCIDFYFVIFFAFKLIVHSD